jgi:transcriptional regulator with XRE-family HTH domain
MKTVNRPSLENAEYPRRLREALAYRKMSARELSRRIGIGETPLGKILNGESVPSAVTLDRMCDELQTHASWVLRGFLPRFYEDPSVDAKEAAPRLSGLERWLQESKEGQAASAEEREWLAHVPWLAPHIRQPDAVYQLVLLAYRQMLSTSQSSTTLEPVSAQNNRVG